MKDSLATEQQAKDNYDFYMSEIKRLGDDVTQSICDKADFWHKEWCLCVEERERDEKIQSDSDKDFLKSC